MSCCGEKRRAINIGYTPVRFGGQGNQKILGNITGRIYKFEGHGSVVSVDNRDVSSVASIPNMATVTP